jgi:diguanylate cyclase (GGDEF)-like protein/PAS domain S-box-containing protein
MTLGGDRQAVMVRSVPLAWLALVFAGVFWVADAVLDVLYFGDGTFVQRVLQPDAHELYIRIVVVALALGLGISAQVLLRRVDRAGQGAQSLKERYERILDAAGEGILALAQDGTVVLSNPAAARMLGYEPGALAGRHQHEIVCHPTEVGPGIDQGGLCLGCLGLTGPGAETAEVDLRRADGSTFAAGIISTPVPRGAHVVGAVICFRDITGRKSREAKIRRLNRLLALVSAVSKAIPRTHEPHALLEAVCRAATETGGLQAAWAGLRQPATGAMCWSARSGNVSAETVEALDQCLQPESPVLERIVGPHDVFPCAGPADPSSGPGRRPGLSAGFFALLPLWAGRRQAGAMALFADAADDFREDAVDLLDAVAEDVSFALLGMEQEEHRQRAEEALEQLARRHEMMLRAAGEGFFGLDADGRTTFANAAAARMLGYQPEELLGRPQHELIHHSRADGSPYPREDCPMFRAVQEGTVQQGVDEVFWRKDGTSFPVECMSTPTVEDGRLVGAVVTFRDVTERRQAEEALRRSEELYRTLAEAMQDMIFIIDREGGIRYVNSFAASQFERQPEDIVGRRQQDVFPAEATERHRRSLDLVFDNGEPTYVEELDSFPRGQVWLGTWLVPIRDGSGNVTQVMGVSRDITDRKRAEEQLLHDAFHDALTGLPNRALFMDRLGRAVERRKRHHERSLAVLFLDLDGFKVINDSLGHAVGDQLLVGTARRLQTILRSGDTVARLGGDEFGVLLDDLRDAAEASRVSERIQRELAQTFVLSGQEVFVQASIGIALNTTGDERPEDLLRDADTAMYRAKALGKGRYELFDPAMHVHAVTRLQLETDLRRAVERDEFRLHYQPIVHLQDGQVHSMEALVRWQHPVRGLVPPMEFIPVAEETGLIVPLGEWVLREACRQMWQWEVELGSAAPRLMSVNLSSKQFTQPDLIDKVREILGETGLDPGRLGLELTESVIMDNASSTTVMLTQLTELRIHLAIDDFGTGYSSLSYLHRFPIDTLKIDRSFVSRMGGQGENSEIVRTILALAHTLGMTVVAEGVETSEQAAHLKALGCEYAQGFLFSRPVDGKSAGEIMASGVRW